MSAEIMLQTRFFWDFFLSPLRTFPCCRFQGPKHEISLVLTALLTVVTILTALLIVVHLLHY
jgi:hypothetical protein